MDMTPSEAMDVISGRGDRTKYSQARNAIVRAFCVEDRAREELATLEHEQSRHHNSYELVKYIIDGEE